MPRWFRKSATVGREVSCCLPFRRGRENREGEYRPTPTPSLAEETTRTSKTSKRRFGFGGRNLGISESRSNDISVVPGEPSELGQQKTDIMIIHLEDCESPVEFIKHVKDPARPRAPLDLERLPTDPEAGDIDWGCFLPNFIPDAHSNILKVNPPDKFARRPSAPIDLDRYPVSPDEDLNLYTVSESEEYGNADFLRVASTEGTYTPSSPGSSMSSVPPATLATPSPTRRRSLGQRIARFFRRFQRNRVTSF